MDRFFSVPEEAPVILGFQPTGYRLVQAAVKQLLKV